MDTKKTETSRDIDSKIINVINAMDFSDGFTVEKISEMALSITFRYVRQSRIRCRKMARRYKSLLLIIKMATRQPAGPNKNNFRRSESIA